MGFRVRFSFTVLVVFVSAQPPTKNEACGTNSTWVPVNDPEYLGPSRGTPDSKFPLGFRSSEIQSEDTVGRFPCVQVSRPDANHSWAYELLVETDSPNVRICYHDATSAASMGDMPKCADYRMRVCANFPDHEQSHTFLFYCTKCSADRNTRFKYRFNFIEISHEVENCGNLFGDAVYPSQSGPRGPLPKVPPSKPDLIREGETETGSNFPVFFVVISSIGLVILILILGYKRRSLLQLCFPGKSYDAVLNTGAKSDDFSISMDQMREAKPYYDEEADAGENELDDKVDL